MYTSTKNSSNASIYLGNYHLTSIHLIRCLMAVKMSVRIEPSDEGELNGILASLNPLNH